MGIALKVSCYCFTCHRKLCDQQAGNRAPPLQRAHESVFWSLGSFRMLHAIAASVPISSHSPQQASPFVKLKLQKKKKNKHIKKAKGLIQATSIPTFPEQPASQTAEKLGLHNPNSRPSPPPAQQRFWRTFANSKWPRDNESALNKCEPLPLPMTYPGSTPAPKDVETMKNCDPEIKDCRDVIYQWTGECSRCQGTGEISYYKKKGREVICKCITCLGLGHVHKMTLRTDINIVEEADA